MLNVWVYSKNKCWIVHRTRIFGHRVLQCLKIITRLIILDKRSIEEGLYKMQTVVSLPLGI